MDDPATPRLRVRGLDAGYGRVQVLFGLDLDVAPGEAVAVLGTNGAGKTTLLRAVSGLLTPTAGTIALDGDDLAHVERGGARSAASCRCAAPTCSPGSPSTRTSAPPWSRIPKRDATRPARIARVYDVFPALAAHRKQDAASLSGGEQQMVALGCALLFEPRLLLVDELSLGLAPLVVQRLLDVLGALRDDGQSMVVVEQSLAVAARLTDRVVFVEKGAVRFDGAPADLEADEELARSVFLGGPPRSGTRCG